MYVAGFVQCGQMTEEWLMCCVSRSNTSGYRKRSSILSRTSSRPSNLQGEDGEVHQEVIPGEVTEVEAVVAVEEGEVEVVEVEGESLPWLFKTTLFYIKQHGEVMLRGIR